MVNDSMPRPDARFHAWQNNFVTYVNAHPTSKDCCPVFTEINPA